MDGYNTVIRLCCLARMQLYDTDRGAHSGSHRGRDQGVRTQVGRAMYFCECCTWIFKVDLQLYGCWTSALEQYVQYMNQVSDILGEVFRNKINTTNAPRKVVKYKHVQ